MSRWAFSVISASAALLFQSAVLAQDNVAIVRWVLSV